MALDERNAAWLREAGEVSSDIDRLEADGSFEISAGWTPMP